MNISEFCVRHPVTTTLMSVALVAAGLFAYQLWLIRRRARDACLAAFRHNNWLGLTLWIGIVLALAVK